MDFRHVDKLQVGGESHHHYTNTGENEATNQTSIDNVGHVTPHYVESHSYLKAKEHLQDKIVSVLHLQGMPGTGKSEIARKLGSDFSHNSEDLFVKYHIECSDRNHDIKAELGQLAESMVKKKMLLASDASINSAISNMKQGRCKEYANLLALGTLPILIIIEDPVGDKFLEDLLMSIAGIRGRQYKFHVYITSKTKTTCSLPSSTVFQMQEVEGFTECEGLNLLEVTETCQEEEKIAAQEIITRLSGSPLGLWAVKMARLPLTFVEYLRHMENHPLSNIIFEREKEKLDAKKHLYVAILLLLTPKQSEQNTASHWKTICSLAFLHNGNIPQILIGRVMQCVREESGSAEEEIATTQSLNWFESRDFIERLRNYGLCKVDGTEYVGTRVTFHAVVFSAVKIHLQTDAELRTAARNRVIKCLTGIVHKDLRLTKNHEFMIEMLPHVCSILEEKCDGSDLFMQFCYAHLYEVRGAVLGKQPKSVFEAEEFLKESIDIWISIVRGLNGTDICPELVTVYVSDDMLQERVQRIVNEGAKAGEKLMASGFDIEKYISIVLQPKSNEIDFYEQKSNEEVKSYLQIALNSSIALHPSRLRQFMDMNLPLFLERKKLFETYIAERITSVLHTISLLIKNVRDQITREVKKKSEYFSKLAVAICEEVHERFKIAPLFLLLSTRGSVRIKLRALELFQGSERRRVVVETKRFIQENLMEDNLRKMFFYEHGLCKHPQEFDYLRHQHQVTRINTKLMALDPGLDLDIAEADQQCERLHQRARTNKKWGICIRCFVYCGKYWASKGDFAKAVEKFEEALGCEDIRSQSEVTRSFPWACYNHARAVLKGRMMVRAAESKELCEEALKMRLFIFLNLKENLEKVVTELNEMIEVNSNRATE